MRLWIAFAIVTGWAAAASAMRVYLPKPCQVLNHDAVVVATVTAVVESRRRELFIAGSPQAIDRWFLDSTIRLDEVLYATPAQRAVLKPELTVPLVSWAKEPPPPPPPPGQMQMIAVVADGPHFHTFEVGKQYLLFLRKLPKEDGYLVQPDPDAAIVIDERTAERIAEWRQIAKVDNWAWGQVVDGLQVALAGDGDRLRLMTARFPDGRQGVAAQFHFIVALRNTSDRPIAVSHYAFDRFLELGQIVEMIDEPFDLYTGVSFQQEPFNAAKHVTLLQPGEIVALARYGKAPYGDHAPLPVQAGDRRLLATYKATREGSLDGAPFWRGEATTAPLTITVEPLQRR